MGVTSVSVALGRSVRTRADIEPYLRDLVGPRSQADSGRRLPGMTTLEIPKALHRGEEELPFVALGDGTHLQLLQVDVEAGLWVIRTKFEPGVTVPTHKHTGEVFAFTDERLVEVPRVPRGEHRGARTSTSRPARSTP